jgi:hypothetical protein
MKLIKEKGLIHKMRDEYFRKIHHAHESRNTLNIIRSLKFNDIRSVQVNTDTRGRDSMAKKRCEVAKLTLVGLTVCPACNGLWNNFRKYCR